ncbi:MAG: orotidine-5'-phosphate decarboxylase [Alphaproteobacteria bacterium]
MSELFCALDTTDLAAAEALAGALGDAVDGIKLGLEFFGAHGPRGIERLAVGQRPVFLDLKLHDIPNTVAGAVRALLPLEPAILTVHASGGQAMMRAAAEAASEAGADRPRIVGVTILTSLDASDLAKMGWETEVSDAARRLAEAARTSGLDGVVCSPHEAARLRADQGPEFLLVVPGIRPAWAASGDQKRVMTPAEAARAGADVLVVGRPITGADDPGEAARRIAAEVGAKTPAKTPE